MKALGRHLLVECYDCDADSLCGLEFIEDAMLEAARRIGCTIISHKFHQFNPYGVSGAVVIAESHLTIHTWPEYGYAAVDFYTCGDHVDPHAGVKYLTQALRSATVNVTEIARGFIPMVHQVIKPVKEEQYVAMASGA